MALHRVCQPDFENYQHVVSNVDWRFAQQFLHPVPIKDWKPPTLNLESLNDDTAYELEMEEVDENGDPEHAKIRHARGPADAMWMSGCGSSLLLSQKARDVLNSFLVETGQLLQAELDETPVYFFHCTTLLSATSKEGSRVTYLSGGKPSQAPHLVLNPAMITVDGFFRTNWPTPPAEIPLVDYSKIPPPGCLFITQTVADAIAAASLTGFRLEEVPLVGRT